MMRSALRTVDKRWATTNVVRPAHSRRIASTTWVFEGLVIHGLVLDADFGFGDEPFDIVEESGELRACTSVGVEPQRPLPRVDRVIEVGADEWLVEIVELLVELERLAKPWPGARCIRSLAQPLGANRDLGRDRFLDDERLAFTREVVCSSVERPEVEVFRTPCARAKPAITNRNREHVASYRIAWRRQRR